MDKRSDELTRIKAGFQTYKDAMPELAGLHHELTAEAYKDGVLKAKDKRLMAMVGGLASGCKGCTLFQLDEALKLGATADEALEACAVALSLGGTMASSKIAWVGEFLKEKGLLK